MFLAALEPNQKVNLEEFYMYYYDLKKYQIQWFFSTSWKMSKFNSNIRCHSETVA